MVTKNIQYRYTYIRIEHGNYFKIYKKKNLVTKRTNIIQQINNAYTLLVYDINCKLTTIYDFGLVL